MSEELNLWLTITRNKHVDRYVQDSASAPGVLRTESFIGIVHTPSPVRRYYNEAVRDTLGPNGSTYLPTRWLRNSQTSISISRPTAPRVPITRLRMMGGPQSPDQDVPLPPRRRDLPDGGRQRPDRVRPHQGATPSLGCSQSPRDISFVALP